MAKGATPHWPLRAGVAAYARPPHREGVIRPTAYVGRGAPDWLKGRGPASFTN